MNKYLFIVLLALNVKVLAATNTDAAVNITWQEPEKYRDVKPSNGGKKRYLKQTFYRIETYMNELAETLPKGYKLDLVVTDLDLAGHVWPASFAGFGRSTAEVRVIKRVDIPRMHFSYRLIDTNGKQVKNSKVKLKDVSFLERANRHFSSKPLKYEKNMLRRWFNQEFLIYQSR